ncbi:MAG: hypothetical protein H7098_04480 [Oligoflexus sp.]|nr:hypothetical protein [Pseudopedobacter sp.]
MLEHNFDVDYTVPSTKQKIKINKDFIEVNSNKIACTDVKAVKYGVSLIGKAKKPERKHYNIDIQSHNGESISIKFSSNKVEELLEEDHTYYYIMSGLWQYVKKHLVTEYITALNENKGFGIGNTQVTQQGFVMSYTSGFLFWKKSKTDLVPWNDVKYFLKEGVLHIDSISDRRKKETLSLHNDWNAVVLNTLLHYLWQDHRKEKLAKGQTI